MLAHVIPLPASPWQWSPNPQVWAVVVALLGGYAYCLRRLGPRHLGPGEPAATPAQKAYWLLGVLTLWVASDWPVDTLADHYLFSVHMLQHMIYALISAPLLLLGLPRWLLRLPLRNPRVMRVARQLTRPAAGLIAFNFTFIAIHWPPVVDLQLQSEAFHLLIHVVILVSGLLMWWPVVSPLPELARLSDPGKMLYLFLQSVLPTIPASFLTFGHHLFYSVYAGGPRYFGISPITDQMISGLTMKIVGGMLLWGVIAAIFYRWYQREEYGSGSMSWEDFERELDAWDMRR